MANNDTLVNGLSPVTQKSNGTVVTAPDICKTPIGSAVVPIPYPNVSKSSDLAKGSKNVTISGAPVCLSSSEFSTSTGDEAGAAKGIISGTTKDKAHPVTYSFNVKVEGKSVVRNTDLFTGNNRNTLPAPIMQSQPASIIGPFDDVVKPCPYCDKQEHPFSKQLGNNMGSSMMLANKIFKDRDKESHPWHSGSYSLQAHHVICSEAVDSDDWAEFCQQFGYNINHKNNGVMLPHSMALACQLHAPLHRGGHAKGWADELNLSYPDAVKKKIDAIADGIERGEFCNDPSAVVEELDGVSEEILAQINRFSWTISADGKDYQSGGNGCAGVDSITSKPKKACPHDRKHYLKHAKSNAIIGAKTKPLEIGE